MTDQQEYVTGITMTTYARRQTILRFLKDQADVKVTDLAKQLQVSEGTIRNDLEALDELGQLRRVRGGAVALEPPLAQTAVYERAQVNLDQKQWIAQWAAGMIESGDAVLFDASTTVLHIATYLHDRHNLTIVTNGLEIGRLLASDPTNTVIVLGGILHTNGTAIIGDMSADILQNIQIQRAFVSCTGFSVEVGLLESHLQETQMKALMLQSVQQTIALVDSSKIQTRGLKPFATLDEIDYFVTDAEMPIAIIEQIRHTGTNVIACGPQTVSKYASYSGLDDYYRIGFANLSETIAFGRDVRRGLEQAATEVNNVELIVADNQLDAQLALENAEDFITQTPDLVIEYQIDEQMGNLIAHRLNQLGIPVIAVDIPMVGATFVGVDNYAAGLVAGQALGQAVQAQWNGAFDYLVVLEHPRTGYLPAMRIQGQIDGFGEYISVVEEARIIRLDCGNTITVSQEQMSGLLDEMAPTTKLPVICFNDDAAIGALKAAQVHRHEQHVLIVGQGADRRLRAELRNPQPCIIGSTAFHPERYGQKLIEISLKILAGDTTPPAVYVPHTFIDRDNVDIHYPLA